MMRHPSDNSPPDTCQALPGPQRPETLCQRPRTPKMSATESFSKMLMSLRSMVSLERPRATGRIFGSSSSHTGRGARSGTTVLEEFYEGEVMCAEVVEPLKAGGGVRLGGTTLRDLSESRTARWRQDPPRKSWGEGRRRGIRGKGAGLVVYW